MPLRASVVGIAAVAASLGAARAPVSTQTTSLRYDSPRCDTANGRGTALHDYIVPIVTAVGAHADRVRASSKLPSGTAGIVTIVADDSVCAAVYNAQVLLKHGGDSTVVASIGLVQVGPNRYVVEDVSRTAGEWSLLDVYDTSLNHLVSITR